MKCVAVGNLHISIKESPRRLEENFQLCQKKVSFKCCCHMGSAEPRELKREGRLSAQTLPQKPGRGTQHC